MTTPIPSRGKLVLRFVVKLSAIALITFLCMELPHAFSDAQPGAVLWEGAVPVACVLALIVFGLEYLSWRSDSRVLKGVNKVLTVLLFIVGAVVPILLVVAVAVAWMS